MSQETATVAEQEYLEIMFWLEEAGLHQGDLSLEVSFATS